MGNTNRQVEADTRRRFPQVLRPIMIAMIPFVLILLAVRFLLLISPWYASWQYQRESFPEDPYGFTVEDRIYWSGVDIQYLQDGSLEIEYFDDFKLDSGEPMHNERELRHMKDVKNLSEGFWFAGRVLILAVVILAALLWNLVSPSDVGRVMQSGARATVIIMLLVFLAVVAGFNDFFVGFHRIFFEGDTWLFRYSDTFIRLYPEMFWRDIFILLAVINLFLAGVFELTGRKLAALD